MWIPTPANVRVRFEDLFEVLGDVPGAADGDLVVIEPAYVDANTGAILKTEANEQQDQCGAETNEPAHGSEQDTAPATKP